MAARDARAGRSGQVPRVAWYRFRATRELSAVPDPTVPAGSIALTALTALLLANAVAALPGRKAALTPPAAFLRAE